MSATEANSHRTGTVTNGDVEISYRHFGSATDQAPILILHGAGYYDSADWVEVAAELAADGRELVAFDARGYGRSSWSPSADYSLDAQLSDIAALAGHLGWERPVYATLADALASTSRDPSSLERPAARARLAEFFTQAPGGYVLSARDPRFQSSRPVDQRDWQSRFAPHSVGIRFRSRTL
jgi:hypothetical protein